ncbi:MAG: endolytic transglycosylase MltG [Prevotella sp.]
MQRRKRGTKKNGIKHNKGKILVAILVIIIALTALLFFTPMSSSDKSVYVCIDEDDTADSVYSKTNETIPTYRMAGFRILAAALGYSSHIRSGRYEIAPYDGALTVIRRMRNGMQAPVHLTIQSVRTLDRLAGAIACKLMTDSATIYAALTDSALCGQYGYTPENIMCMFIPNTYDVYWNISPEKLLDKMDKESKRFWNESRTEKAKSLGLTPTEVITMASIIDEETAVDAEKPMIAGMYYNRLKADMPLQADPTIKFALGDFSIKRIYNNMLNVKSPYNTYRNTGLPPGPIRMASVAAIDAVLNRVNHNYLYMCAKEDFSGTHNFAVTYNEHLANAAKYTQALNQKGIK